jgi:hypothetical protein
VEAPPVNELVEGELEADALAREVDVVDGALTPEAPADVLVQLLAAGLRVLKDHVGRGVGFAIAVLQPLHQPPKLALPVLAGVDPEHRQPVQVPERVLPLAGRGDVAPGTGQRQEEEAHP